MEQTGHHTCDAMYHSKCCKNAEASCHLRTSHTRNNSLLSTTDPQGLLKGLCFSVLDYENR